MYRTKILMNSPGLELGNRGLHSLTCAKPSLYKVRIVLLTPVLEPKITTLTGSLLDVISAGVLEEIDGVGVGKALAKKLVVIGIYLFVGKMRCYRWVTLLSYTFSYR